MVKFTKKLILGAVMSAALVGQVSSMKPDEVNPASVLYTQYDVGQVVANDKKLFDFSKVSNFDNCNEIIAQIIKNIKAMSKSSTAEEILTMMVKVDAFLNDLNSFVIKKQKALKTNEDFQKVMKLLVNDSIGTLFIVLWGKSVDRLATVNVIKQWAEFHANEFAKLFSSAPDTGAPASESGSYLAKLAYLASYIYHPWAYGSAPKGSEPAPTKAADTVAPKASDTSVVKTDSAETAVSDAEDSAAESSDDEDSVAAAELVEPQFLTDLKNAFVNSPELKAEEHKSFCEKAKQIIDMLPKVESASVGISYEDYLGILRRQLVVEAPKDKINSGVTEIKDLKTFKLAVDKLAISKLEEQISQLVDIMFYVNCVVAKKAA